MIAEEDKSLCVGYRIDGSAPTFCECREKCLHYVLAQRVSRGKWNADNLPILDPIIEPKCTNYKYKYDVYRYQR